MNRAAGDPFGESLRPLSAGPWQLLGGRFTFHSNRPWLLELARSAYGNLPPQHLEPRGPAITIHLQEIEAAAAAGRPPPLSLFAGSGWLGGAQRGSNAVLLVPEEARALVLVSPGMRRFPYHVRYEFIEFAVLSLAARCQSLVPLHAACVGSQGRGVLLLGESGAGKSTVALCAMLAGLDLLSEDSVFVQPASLLAVGAPNFLHVRAPALRWADPAQAALIRRAPTTRRRSGVRKYEFDLRGRHRPATSAMRLVAAVQLSVKQAKGELLKRRSAASLLKTLAKDQPFAARQPQWAPFARQFRGMDTFELRRGEHPKEAVAALQALLRR